MIDYADTASCLRATILQYFGETGAAQRCTSCGNCRPEALDAYERDLVRKILAGIARAGERYGRSRIANMLLGIPEESPTALGRPSTFGLLRHETADALRGWMSACVSARLVAISTDQYRTPSLTDRGRAFMQGRLDHAIIRRPSLSGRSRLRGVRAHPLKAHSSGDWRRSLSRRFR